VQSPEHERRAVISYWESQSSPDESVIHAEKIHTESLGGGNKYDVWDVHATDGRWWIITNPINLYLQEQFPSMDYALSFHIGVTHRVLYRDRRTHETSEQRDRFSTSFRRLEQADDALREADEAEEFQAVGMRCRECLLAFIRETTTDDMVPEEQKPPKRGDFVHWSDLIASNIATGSSVSRLRGYLRNIAKSAWELVNWLTHAENATRLDGELAVEATGHVITVFSYALVRYERGEPARCPVCSSYRLSSDYRPELGADGAYVTLCEACGWEDTLETQSST
jgi:hypothetical protein